jgi:hypothetical protein
MRTEIHIAREGKQFGPYTLEEVNRNLQQGLLQPTDLAWHEGMTNWAALSTLEGVVTATGGQRPPPPPAAPGGPPKGAKPDTYLVSAILATLFCCLPFGVVAIVYAAQVDSKWHAGDQAGAQEASGKAKLWSNVSALTGVVILGGWILVGVLSAM